ncbi:hypothetical protein ACFV6U_09925 [Streptomyces sp. NPDC059810]|uniref:hypothetical protein n=2 Tax=Streptomyces TaxID=1883 RepID=UPI00366659BD
MNTETAKFLGVTVVDRSREEVMNPSPVHLMILALLLAVVTLFCILVGAAAGLLARLDGATYASALLRGALAFAGSATLGLALLTFVLTVL